MNLKLLSLNIWNYNEPWEVRKQIIVDTVIRENPDIIGFQEIRYDENINRSQNQAEQLIQMLNKYKFVYKEANIYSNKPRHEEGLAIMSRYPIIESNFCRLTRNAEDPEDRHDRIVLHAAIQLPVGCFHFFNTHLSLSEQARNRTIREVDNFVKSFDTTLPKVIVGDFNSLPNSEVIKFLTGKTEIDGERSSHYQDAWATVHPKNPGYTYRDPNSRIGYTFVATPNERIDYIFVTPPKSNQILDISLTANTPNNNGIYPSDHLGLVAIIKIEAQ